MTKAVIQEALAELPDEFSLDDLMERLILLRSLGKDGSSIAKAEHLPKKKLVSDWKDGLGRHEERPSFIGHSCSAD